MSHLLETNGFHPEKYTTNVFQINPGTIGDSTGVAQIVSNGYISVDLTTVGLNGKDTNWALGVSNHSQYTQIYLYVLQQISTGIVGVVASLSITYGGVTLPSGWTAADTLMRKLPFGVPYDPIWDGIPDYHCASWPAPLITFTDQEYSGSWMPLVAGAAGAWTDVDCSKWIPDNARLGLFTFETRDAGVNAAGSAYVRSSSIQTTGVLIGSTTPAAQFNMNTRPLRVTSDRKIQYKVTPGSRLNVYCLGYYQTEPS